MSPASGGFAILHWLPWWIVDKWCGEKRWCAMMCLYKLPCTQLSCNILSFALYTLRWHGFCTGSLETLYCFSTPWPQPSQTKPDWVYAGSYWFLHPIWPCQTDKSSPTWLEYVHQTVHPALCWLPTKLVELIGENLQVELGFPDKADRRAEPGSGWTPAELIQAHVVDGALTSFGCVEWESELFRGTMRARCYPFDMPKRRFHSFNPKDYQPFSNISCQYLLIVIVYFSM